MPEINKKKQWIRTGLVTAAAVTVATVGFSVGGSEGVADPGWRFRGDLHSAGDPLPGMSPELLELFDEGRIAFEHEFTPEEGLGPIYNERACQTCHGGLGAPPGGPDGEGVGSPFNVTHFGYDADGTYLPLRELGGPVIQHTSIRDEVPGCDMAPETLPEEANVVSIRHTPAVWGFGLIDAIPDAEILKRENLGVDGVRGVANWGREMVALAKEPHAVNPQLDVRGPARVGRFGWKSQTATLLQFSEEPFGIELGVTTPFFPQGFTPEGVRFGHELPPGCDVAETHPNDVDGSISAALYAFQALTAPPPRLPLRGKARAGKEIFEQIGCDTCHTPIMRTGPEYWLQVDHETRVRVPQLENQEVHLYSDLLTHDMGDLLADDGGTTAGRVMGRADGRRWRTTPLWGLRFKSAFLHDGRTDDLREAILLHGGEAEIIRSRFAHLPRKTQDLVLEFLMSI